MPKVKFREIAAMTSRIREEDSEEHFYVTEAEQKICLYITNGQTVIGDSEFVEVSEDLLVGLESESELSDEQQLAIVECQKIVRNGIERLIDVLKYAMGYIRWEKDVSYRKDAHQYSTDGKTWKVISHEGELSATFSTDSHPRFDYVAVPFIQEMLDSPSMLLETALFHLHRARNQNSSPKHAIIDACIAVEVGVKEFFMKFKPDLTPILDKLPSPPVTKLYGDIMEAYAGKKFSPLDSLAKLADKRNKLVHSPLKDEPSEEETRRFVLTAERAVYWLHSILDRKNIFFPNLLECREQALEDLKTGKMTLVTKVKIQRPDEFPLPRGADPNWFK